MKKDVPIEHEFVTFMPKVLDERKIYVSIEYATAVHKCLCGCGSKVVTPISPAGWQLLFDGETVSLTPSIGNWSFKCRSHYWVRRNKAVWSDDMTEKQVAAVRASDRDARQAYFGKGPSGSTTAPAHAASPEKRGFWHRFLGRK